MFSINNRKAVVLSGKHLPFLKSKPRHPSGWRGFYFTTRAIAAVPL
jgi:hypothetical protein